MLQSITRLLPWLPLAAAPLFAQAPTVTHNAPRWYVSGVGGWESRGIAAESSTTYTEWKDGSTFAFQLGYRILPQVRIEAEYGAYRNDAKVVAPPPGPGGGEAKLISWQVNAFYDMPIGQTPFTFYAGAGAGQFLSKLRGLTNPTLTGFGVFLTDDSDWVAAWNVQAGFSYAYSRQVDLLLGYRYFRGGKLHFEFPGGFTAGPERTTINAIQAGVRFNF